MKAKPFSIVLVGVLAVSLLTGSWAQNFGEWSSPVNVGSPPNAAREDWQPFITKDGRSLYFVRGISPNNKIWVAKRSTIEDTWGEPELLPATVNSPNAGHPFVTPDGHWLYFNAPGPFGAADIWRSWRQNKRTESGPGGWQIPENLGGGVNTTTTEQAPWLFEDEVTGQIILYFTRLRSGNHDIFQSTMQPDGTFDLAHEVEGFNLNTADGEETPTVSHNGRELYFISNRPGSILTPLGVPSRDIWVSIRESTFEPWSEPQPATSLNSPFHDGRPALSWDGSAIYFFSAGRTGNVDAFFDIWMATREKSPDND